MMYSYIHKQYIPCGHQSELVIPRKGQDVEQAEGQGIADVNEVKHQVSGGSCMHNGCTIDLSINPWNYMAISSGRKRLLACLPRGKSSVCRCQTAG